MIVYVHNNKAFKQKAEFWKTWHICHCEADNIPKLSDSDDDITDL